MVIKDLLNIGMTLIKDRKYSNPLLESILVLSKVLDVDKSYIYAHLDKIVDESIKDEFLNLMKKRSIGYPIQYILGEKDFMGLNLYIEEGVLIPRGDTEVLVDYIISYIKEEYLDEEAKILEIGSGSGAISLSIGKYCSNAQVYAVDIEDIPIRIGNINKERLGITNVNFFKGDLFQPISQMKLEGKFDIIVSNPPYISKDELEDLESEVKDFEPRTALDGGVDGLDFYREITKESKSFLARKGLLIYEIGYKQAIDVKNILIKEGFQNTRVIRDLQGLDRVVCGVMK